MNAKPTVTVLFVFSFNCLLPFNSQANLRAEKNLRFTQKRPATLIGGHFTCSRHENYIFIYYLKLTDLIQAFVKVNIIIISDFTTEFLKLPPFILYIYSLI